MDQEVICSIQISGTIPFKALGVSAKHPTALAGSSAFFFTENHFMPADRAVETPRSFLSIVAHFDLPCTNDLDGSLQALVENSLSRQAEGGKPDGARSYRHFMLVLF